MQTLVNLQEPMGYSFLPILLCFLIIIGVVIFLILTRKKVTTNNNAVKVIPQKNVKNIPVIKNKYLKELENIENKYQNNEIQIRKAYQLISEAVRMFVFEITDISTQNYSLKEIKKLSIPNLYEAIEEYYEPEFASKSTGDFETSIKKAKEIVKNYK